ncbi:MAG: hypothetical protein K1X35_07330 [Caulobacteraceae bacterium]|nr:hypothetical protein [Caulobacteraceae bacterium]
MSEGVDTWARIRQRNLEKIVAKLLAQDGVPKKLLKDWMDKSADPNQVEQSIEATQKIVDWLGGEYDA